VGNSRKRRFSTLVAAVKTASLETLNGGQHFTVFAPNNAALLNYLLEQ
jgi:uncharacterized surface protein with fasciclin (FAS1) repeats